MAKFKFVPHKYYIYYEKKTGQILAVSNEKKPNYEYGLELPFEDVEKFLTGEWNFSDYSVGYKRLADGTTTLGVMLKTSDGYSFKNNIFEWITEDKTADCTVEWKENAGWIFDLKPAYRKVCDEFVLPPKLVFFVTLDDDFDFLIRTIFINTSDLLSGEVVIPFDSSFEKDSSKVSISSKLVFKSYGLKVTHE